MNGGSAREWENTDNTSDIKEDICRVKNPSVWLFSHQRKKI
jgi:hypothetical protein